MKKINICFTLLCGVLTSGVRGFGARCRPDSGGAKGRQGGLAYFIGVAVFHRDRALFSKQIQRHRGGSAPQRLPARAATIYAGSGGGN